MSAVTEHRLPSAASMAAELAVHISGALRRLLSVQTSAVLAVSGGKSPIALFQALSMQDLPWHAVQITLVDDRCVHNNHADSNAALVRKYLLCNYAKSATFYPLIDWDETDEAPDLEAVAARATADIKRLGGVDVVILGMGPDGHTASLFPFAPQLKAGLDLTAPPGCLHVSPETAPYERISLNLSAILSADTVCVAIGGGADKHAVYRGAKEAITNNYPVSHVLGHRGDQPRISVWLHD
ncbi:MAG: 6-phosphogluconolactonase [Burkholderiaceae bacterium]